MNWTRSCIRLAYLCIPLSALAPIAATAALADEAHPPFIRGWAVDVAADLTTPPYSMDKVYDKWGPRFTFGVLLPADFELGLFVVWPDANGDGYDHPYNSTTFHTLTVGGRVRYAPHWKVAPVAQAGMGMASTWYESVVLWPDGAVQGSAHGSGTQLFLEGGGGLAVSPFMGLRLALLVVYKWQMPKTVESQAEKSPYSIPNNAWWWRLPAIDELALRAEVGWRF